jgi:hypothetical protein
MSYYIVTEDGNYYYGKVPVPILKICRSPISPCSVKKKFTPSKQSKEINFNDLKSLLKDFMSATDYPYNMIDYIYTLSL